MREPLCNNCGLASRPAGRGWAPLAHAWLEQRTHNPLVPCSTHGGGTIRALAIPMRTSSETASDTRLCRIAAIRRLPPLISRPLKKSPADAGLGQYDLKRSANDADEDDERQPRLPGGDVQLHQP